MQKREAEVLFKKYRDGKANADDVNKLLAWIQEYEELHEVNIPLHELEEIQADLASRLPITKPRVRRLYYWPKIAAAALVIVFFGIFFFTLKLNQGRQKAEIANIDIAPGTNKATLTLANGKKVILSKSLHGKIGIQGSTAITMGGDSSIVYVSGSPSNTSRQITYNTLSTVKGEQSPFPLILADGTKVWLNAASSLVFPTEFNGPVREVRLIGEAYFKVAHNNHKTFIVRSGSHIVQDIGTEFNVNSYTDEYEIRTTLVEGAVKVSNGALSKTLKPGEQARASANGLMIAKGDIESDLAWMNGKFIFHDEELHSVMRKLSRWYNIDVKYEYDPQGIVFGGVFSKNRNILKILDALEQVCAVRFRISGKTVTVIK